jgi:lauroyl/myristoyl acyltransferase
MRYILGIFGFWPLRILERVLSVSALRRLVKPLSHFRAVLNSVFKKSPAARTLPGCFTTEPIRIGKRHRQALYLNEVLELIPDRLATAKWRSRCRMNGLEHLQAAQRSGKPVVLAFCHFGHYPLLRFWLRAAGVPVSTLVHGKPESRSLLRRLQDRRSPFPELPPAFYSDQLSDAVRSLADGNPLLIAVDFNSGKQLDVPVTDGWKFRMATGAIRLAISHDAELIPCILIDEGDWRFRLEIGVPVPKEFLTKNAGWSMAGKHLIDHISRHMRSHPEQCSGRPLACFFKDGEVREPNANAFSNSLQPAA